MSNLKRYYGSCVWKWGQLYPYFKLLGYWNGLGILANLGSIMRPNLFSARMIFETCQNIKLKSKDKYGLGILNLQGKFKFIFISYSPPTKPKTLQFQF
jgi:hypothetical protein